MSEITTEQPTETTEATGAKPDESAELGENGVKALAAERDARKAAEKSAADLAKRLKAFEDRDKTEAEKTAERLAAAEQRAAELEAKATRAEVAAAKGVPAALLTGSTTEELEASADALIAFRGEQGGNRLLIPTEGKTPSRQVSDDVQFAKDLFTPRGD